MERITRKESEYRKKSRARKRRVLESKGLLVRKARKRRC